MKTIILMCLPFILIFIILVTLFTCNTGVLNISDVQNQVYENAYRDYFKKDAMLFATDTVIVRWGDYIIVRGTWYSNIGSDSVYTWEQTYYYDWDNFREFFEDKKDQPADSVRI